MEREYWFAQWMHEYSVSDLETLRKALSNKVAFNALLEWTPSFKYQIRKVPPAHAELTGGKGVDLTGDLGCTHYSCIAEEVDRLFRHTWHYFDRITLPDQAINAISDFKKHNDKTRLSKRLCAAVHAVTLIEQVDALGLVHFEIRAPSCRMHFKDHAKEADILQAFQNLNPLVEEILKESKISFSKGQDHGKEHLHFKLDHPKFLHSEWGSFCPDKEIPPDKNRRRAAVQQVIEKYLAAVSADALASRRTKTPLGSTVPFYRDLLNTNSTADIGAVAFDLELPVASNMTIDRLIALRKNERDAFDRFQGALRKAIFERINAGASKASEIGKEIRQDLIDPEIRRIRELLVQSRKLSLRGASSGIVLGATATTVGLMSPLSASSIGTGLAVGGAMTALGSVKKALDDHWATKKEVALSDMYFLWEAHRH